MLTVLLVVSSLIWFSVCITSVVVMASEGTDEGLEVLFFPFRIVWRGIAKIYKGIRWCWRTGITEYRRLRAPPTPTDILVHMIAQRMIKHNLEDCLISRGEYWKDPDTGMRVPFTPAGRASGGFGGLPRRIVISDTEQVYLSERQGYELQKAYETADRFRIQRVAAAEEYAKESTALNAIERLMNING
jgi:hypothetical protein